MEIEVLNTKLRLDDVVAVLGRAGLDVGAISPYGDEVQLLHAIILAEEILAVHEVAQVVGAHTQALLQLPGMLPAKERPNDVVQSDRPAGFILGIGELLVDALLGSVHTIESIIIANKIKPAKTMSSLS